MNELDQQQKLIEDRADLRKAYEEVFLSSAGKKILKQLCRECGVFTPIVVSGDPHMTYYHEGQRSIVLAILRQIGGIEALYSE